MKVIVLDESCKKTLLEKEGVSVTSLIKPVNIGVKPKLKVSIELQEHVCLSEFSETEG